MNSSGEATNQLIPELEALLNLWRSRYAAGPLPEDSLLSERDLEPRSRNLAWIDHTQDDRFIGRKFGLDLIRRFGREATGHSVDGLAKDFAAGLRESLWHAILTGAPVISSLSVQLGDEAATFSELILPMSGGTTHVAEVLAASHERTFTQIRPARQSRSRRARRRLERPG
ncbi:MAG TPA: hypothetical protein VHZ29_05130 [Rhizomicrobium sp.]|nr:hypothetical protein [Rhizomicrobium sp.]